MKLSQKREILEYVKAHNDGGDIAARIIRLLEIELKYADLDFFSVSIDDLENYEDAHPHGALRKKLGKEKGDEFTIKDCERIAEVIEETGAERFFWLLQEAINLL